MTLHEDFFSPDEDEKDEFILSRLEASMVYGIFHMVFGSLPREIAIAHIMQGIIAAGAPEIEAEGMATKKYDDVMILKVDLAKFLGAEAMSQVEQVEAKMVQAGLMQDPGPPYPTMSGPE